VAALKLYFDHHIPKAIALGLHLRKVDVLTAYEDGSHELPDDDLLDRATSLGRVLVTQDDDLLAEAKKRQQAGTAFSGVIYSHQDDISIGQSIHDLQIITEAGTENDVANLMTFLPL